MKNKILTIIGILLMTIGLFACEKQNISKQEIETPREELIEETIEETVEETIEETVEEAKEEYIEEPTEKPETKQTNPLAEEEIQENLVEKVKALAWAKDVNQIILVVGTEQTRAHCMFLEKKEGVFEVKYATLAWIGEAGMGKTKEGDCKTPTGVYSLSHPFGRNENPGCEIPYVKLDDSWYWVEDGNSKYYNQMVTTEEVTMDWTEAEQLNTFGYSYNYAVAIDFNKERIPGIGSAIFLHCTHNSPTRGCIAIEEEHMMNTLQMLKEGAVIAIYTDENMIK